MLGRFAPGIRRASGPVPVTADVGHRKKCRFVIDFPDFLRHFLLL